MAISESIRDELNALFDARVQAENLYQALELVGDQDRLNPIVYLVRCHIERWASVCDALEKTLRQNAIPLIEDLAAIKKPK